MFSGYLQLQDLNGTGKDLSMDWISRTLYTVEEESMTKSRIMGYHIDQDTYEEILLRSKPVGSIVTDPYTRYVMSVGVNLSFI